MREKGKKRGREPGGDGDGRARKHLQRIGLTRVFNPARGFLGEIKRGTGKKGLQKDIAHATHFGTRARKHTFLNTERRIAGVKGSLRNGAACEREREGGREGRDGGEMRYSVRSHLFNGNGFP